MEAMMSTWQTFALGLGRVGTFVMLVPVLGGRAMPRLVKILVSVALVLFGLRMPGLVNAEPVHSLALFNILLIKEMLVGFLLGFTIILVLAACQAVGEIIGFQMMFAASATFLPVTQERSTVMGNFVYIFSILVFVTIDGHHALIRGLDLSFRTLPVLAMPSGIGPFSAWMKLFGDLFRIGLQLALPLLGALLITNLMLGMIAKTMPQINVFIVGMPIQILAGLIVLFFMMSALLGAEMSLFRNWAQDLRGLIRAMAP